MRGTSGENGGGGGLKDLGLGFRVKGCKAKDSDQEAPLTIIQRYILLEFGRSRCWKKYRALL